MKNTMLKYGFYHLGNFCIDDEKIRLHFIGSLRHVVYSFVCEDKVVYVGKTTDFRKRLNQYRNSITSRSYNHVDTCKANYIIDKINEGKPVSVYIRQGFDVKGVRTYELEEPLLIEQFKPVLNSHYRGKNAKRNN